MKIYRKICACCGKEFEAHMKNKQYCSRKCKDVGYKRSKGQDSRLEPRYIVCVVCGKEFDTTNATKKTCSDECSRQLTRTRKGSKSSQIKKKCAICGKTFETWWNNQKTCGDEACKCEYKKQAKKRRDERAKRIKPSGKIHTIVEKECKYCGTLFQCFDYEHKITCSDECSKKYAWRRKDRRISKEQMIDTDITLKRLFKRDRGVCWICGGVCDWKSQAISMTGHSYPGKTYPVIDHVIPISRGGLHSWDNVRLAHWQCNADKSDSLFPYVPLDKAFAYSVKTKGTQPKKTAQYSLDGNLIRVWDSTAQIRKELGLNDKHIQNICRRDKSKTGNAYGFHWEYLDG